MSIAEKFIVQANPVGLPKTWCLVTADGTETVIGLSVQEVTKLYWLLEKVTLSYSYTLKGLTIYRKCVLICPTSPKERIASIPSFEYFSDNVDGVEYSAYLDMESIAQVASGYGFNFNIIENDAAPTYVVSTETIPGYVLSDQKTATFMGHSLTLKLWSGERTFGGNLNTFTIDTLFYSFP